MFNFKKHLIKVQGGREYLPVSARLIWFREEHPDWGITTAAVTIDTEKQFAIFKATVFDANGKLMAEGTKMERRGGFPDYVEKAETGAIGRALAVCGFGTQFAPDIDELVGHTSRYVDSPQGNRRFVVPPGYDPDDRTTGDIIDTEAGKHDCSCGVALTIGQEAFSRGKFGQPLCPACQRDAQRIHQVPSRMAMAA